MIYIYVHFADRKQWKDGYVAEQLYNKFKEPVVVYLLPKGYN